MDSKQRDLEKAIKDMIVDYNFDVPESRIESMDTPWMLRNLAIRNGKNPKYRDLCELCLAHKRWLLKD